MNQARKLRGLIDNRNQLLIVPGVSNAFFARLVEDAGYDAVYASGAGISNMYLGWADVGLTTMTEVLDQVRRIVDATTLPVIADIDTGYGNPINVYRTVKEFSKAGVAAVQLEDQVSPKKCGHFNNKSIIPKEEMIYKIQAALDADPDLVLIARTDARATNGIEEALERANAYYEAGAYVTFVEAPESEDEMERIPREVPCYQVANIVENGLTPHVSNKDLLQMGYSIALYANLTMRAAVFGAQMALKHLDEHGETKTFLDRMITMKERNRLTRLTEIEKMELKYGIR